MPRYNMCYNLYNVELDPGTINDEESQTVQAFAGEVNINQIMARMVRGEAVENLQAREALFGDFTEVGSYHEAQQRLLEINAEFMALSPDIRLEFENDPAKLIAFVSDDKNKDKAIELGLIPKPEEVKETPPMKVEVVNQKPVEPAKAQ